MLRRILRLSIGATAATAVNAAIYPVLARYYEPAHIGVLGFYFSTTQLLAVVIGLRYEQAIALRASMASKTRAAGTALGIGAALAIVVFVGTFLLSNQLDRLFSVQLGWFWSMAAVNSYVVFCTTVLTQLMIAGRLEKRVAISRNVKALSAGATQVGLALLVTPKALLLIIGEFTGALLGFFVSVLAIRHDLFRAVVRKVPHRRYLAAFAWAYRAQPIWNLPQTLINSTAGLIVISSIAIHYDASMAGSYFLMYRILMLPSALVAAPMAQVFMHEASTEIRRSGNFARTMLVLIATQGMIALMVTPPLMLFGPSLFSFVLGEKWRVAGELASTFAPYIAFHLILSAAGNCTIIANRQKAMLIVALGQNLMFTLPFVLAPSGQSLGQTISNMLMFSTPYMGAMIIWYFYLSKVGRTS